MTDASKSERPSQILSQEHRIIERVLRVLGVLIEPSEAGEGLNVSSLHRCVEFFKLFADACHHAKEEDLLFPALEARGIPRDGGPIGVMLYEHQQARALTAHMADALDSHERGEVNGAGAFREAAAQYIALLGNHIHKEDNILFRMGDSVLTTGDQASLCSRFCEVGCRTFGGKRREDLERIADDLEKAHPLS